MQREFFAPVVGLRAYLALWVAIGHALVLAGFQKQQNALIAFLLRSDAAVSVFIVLSGFVITNLLVTGREAYGPYIVRRFFRLFPAYAVCCVLGFVTLPYWVSAVRSVPWHDAPAWHDYRAMVEEIATETWLRPWPHLVLHATMLHGVVPAEVLNRAATTFLPAAWSISLEWQFYLLAPAILMCLGSGPRSLVLFGAAAILYAAASKGLLGTYQAASSITVQSGYFAIGIASRLALDRIRREIESPAIASVGLAVVAFMLLKDPLPVLVWAVFLGILAESPRETATAPIRRLLLTNPTATAIGDASYSLYLLHRPVQVMLVVLAMRLAPATPGRLLASQLLATALAALASLGMYRYLEKPGNRWGRRLADAWARSQNPAFGAAE
jgi:peptidoglycan/LPS O-acetylase OafA/YrhL